jgi:hypothetical protein
MSGCLEGIAEFDEHGVFVAKQANHFTPGRTITNPHAYGAALDDEHIIR